MAFYPRVGCKPKPKPYKPPPPPPPDVINAFGPMQVVLRDNTVVALWLVVNETRGDFEFAEEDGTERTEDVRSAEKLGRTRVEGLVLQLPEHVRKAMQESMKRASDVRMRWHDDMFRFIAYTD